MSRLFQLFAVFTLTFSSSTAYSNSVVLDGGKYNASWYYDEASDSLNFTVVVETTGWVGFGFSDNAPTGMVGYDVAVAGVQGGNGYIVDYITTSTVKPTTDTQQDFNLTSFAEADGKTTLMFTRKRDTNDSMQDVVIKVGMPMFLVWAYHNSADSDSVATLLRHSKRGWVQVTFVEAPAPPPPPPPPPMMDYTGNVSLYGGKYNASWLYRDGMDYVYFRVDAMAMGWVGFGLAHNAPTNMMNYDVAVGGVINGSGYLKDYFTQGRMAPPADSQQDWNLTYSREMDGVTTLLFHRKINTNDTKDVVIKQGEMYLVWAYHSMYDVEPSFMKHSKRGVTKIQIIPEKHVSFKNGTYNAYWRYDSVDDTLKFKVVVKATGWVAFGFAKQAPTNMENYDVAVGGVYNGQGYLRDYLTRARGQVPADVQQDFELTNASESGGVTTLWFSRKRVTWDSEDLAVMSGQKLFIVWAYARTGDIEVGPPFVFPTHMSTDRGFTPQAVEIIGQETASLKFDKHMTFDGGNFNAYWSFDNATDSLRFKLVVKATGWVAFGFARARGNMLDYDVAVGGVWNGKGYLEDRLTKAPFQVPADDQQDFQLTYAHEEAGTTTLMFYRKRDTSDINDISIEGRQKLFLVWAYAKTDDKTESEFPIHNERGGTNEAVEIISQETPAVTNYDKQVSYDEGNFRAYWAYDSDTDSLTFKLVVKATGWVAFGFATTAPADMENYDVAVGGVRNGVGYIKDYLTGGFGKVPADTQQDFTLLSSSEEGGVTTLTFRRKRDTGDDGDLRIEGRQELFLVWAYTNSEDIAPDEFATHDKKGSSRVAMEIIAEETPTRAPTTAATTNPVTNYDKQVSYDEGNFRAYWAYDSDTDSLTFKLVVKATGWVAFGFARARGNMLDYDVAVGGVWNGQGYLEDRLTKAPFQVPADGQQDLQLTYAHEEAGTTTLMFNRKRDTSDINDISIEGRQKLFLVWAYAKTDDKTDSEFPIHDERGGSDEAVEIISQDTPAVTNYEKQVSYDEGNFRAYWAYDSNTDSLTFKLVVKATGWVAFGFATTAPADMENYDVAVGGVRNGVGYIKDYLTRGFGKVPADTQQDFTLLSSSEEGGVTTLTFRRKRDTGDDGDLRIEGRQELFLVWAYTNSEDITPEEFPTHDKKGSSRVAMEIIAAETPTRAPTTVNNAAGLDAQQELEEAREERELLKILVAVSLGIVSVTFIVVVFGFAYLSRKVRVGPTAMDSKL